MNWFSKINSAAFKDWLVSRGGGTRVSPGRTLDPFGSSMRKFNNAHSWIKKIYDTGALSLSTARATDQAKIDLRSSKILEAGTTNLTVLGRLTYEDWVKYGIPESDKDYEIHRCFLLLKNALIVKDNQYKGYLDYWRELRNRFSFPHLIGTPEHLYFFTYFNFPINNYNPYDAIIGLKMLDTDFPSAIDWNVIKTYYNDTQVDAAANKLQSTIDGIVDRQGRTNFVIAMELIQEVSNTNTIIAGLPLTAQQKELLTQIVDDFKRIPMASLNTILYGPPGTGKTHNSINHALSIVTGRPVADLLAEQKANPATRNAAKKQFDALVASGQVQFVTFHQSYSYEDFVEGIKSVVNAKGDVEYRVESGIFKKICIEAGKRKSPSLSFEDAYDTFVQEVTDAGGKFELKTPSQSKPFNVKISSFGNSVAIPKTKDATEMTITKGSLKAYIENGTIKDWKSYTTAIGDYIKTTYISKSTPVDNASKKFVLIIDEINRGNISKIFGELITLIERSKRLGEEEEIRVKLTYSGAENNEDFGVPNNLYIIGTMNSADKSISLVDTALRRRFEFIEYSADPSLLSNNVEGINLQELLKTINARIEILLDKDHMIGHAYLIGVKTKNQLCEVFRNRIIPLLEEYFFSDYEKIQLILGDNTEFNKDKANQVVKGNSAGDQKNLFGRDVDGFEEKTVYHLNEHLLAQNYEAVTPQFFISMYTKTPKTA